MNSQSTPLQNRVTPLGEIIAHPARGTWMGNRGGRFHDPETKTLGNRRWASRAWICCRLTFNDRHRPEIMGPGYTELFFMDEVTALAAGHRPCFECRRKDAQHFLELYGRANGLKSRPRAAEFDRLAQASRCNGRVQKTHFAQLGQLPSGVMMQHHGNIYAKTPHGLKRWSIEGYREKLDLPLDTVMEVLTPQLFTGILLAGYSPHWHETMG